MIYSFDVCLFMLSKMFFFLQVVREACITIAHMAKVLKNKLDQFTLYIMQEVINLIQNAAKVSIYSKLYGNLSLSLS